MGYIVPPPPRDSRAEIIVKQVSHEPTYSGGEDFASWKIWLFLLGLTLTAGIAYAAIVCVILPYLPA